MKFYLTLFLLCLTLICSSQSFDIFNSKSEVKILGSDFLEIGVKINDDENCCDHIVFEGFLTSTFKDSLVFNFSSAHIHQELNSTKTDFNSKYLSDYSNQIIAKKDIVFLNEYSSKRNKSLRDNLSPVGALFAVGGLITAINALIFADNSKKTLLIASGIQFSTGIAMSIGFHKSKKQLRLGNDPWTIR